MESIINKIDSLIQSIKPAQNPMWSHPTTEQIVESLEAIKEI